MKEQEEEVQRPQQSPGKPAQPQSSATSQPHGSKSDLVAELLRDKLATKLTEDELTSLIREVTMLQKQPQSMEDRVNNLKSSVDYIEYKCREIERALRATDRHVRPRDREHRERVFRDRSPLGINRSPLGISDLWSRRGFTSLAFGDLSDGLVYGGIRSAVRSQARE